MAQSGIAAGAQAGAAFGPWGAAIGGIAGGVSDGINAAMGGPFMGGDSKATYGDVITDHSGWTVNVGGGSASTDNRQNKPTTRTTTDTSLPSQMGLPVGGGVSYVGGGMTDFAGVSAAGINPLMLLAMGGLLLVAIKRKGKR